MPEPPNRKRFQIHLSTAIVLMFVAGGLIWTNCGVFRSKSIMYPFYEKSWGWPLTCTTRVVLMRSWATEQPLKFDTSALIVNFTFSITVLFSAWFFCEWLIRRRAQKEP